MKTKIRNSISGVLLIPLVVACFALLPSVQATPDPANPGGANTADGANALQNRTTGEFNTAFGTNALFSLTTGDNNGAQGNSALFSCTDGNGNSAVGSIALRFLTSGDHNVAIGNTALNALTTGSRNTAIGYGTLRSGNFNDNTAVGWSALLANTTGDPNTAVGSQALRNNTTGHNNTATGFQALFDNNAGNNNTAYGYRALANTTGTNNIALGFNAGLNISIGSNNIDIGNPGAVFGESSTIRIGSASQSRTFIAGIRGVVPGVGITLPVIIDLNGQLGNIVSSRRFKNEIKPMDQTSEAIHALKPVTFHYKSDSTGTPQFGLIAEDVAEVNPDLVAYDNDGQPLSVRYEMVNAMLLNEFLKEHRKNEEQQATIARLQKQIEALSAGLQKVSAQLELSKAAPQTVAENQ